LNLLDYLVGDISRSLLLIAVPFSIAGTIDHTGKAGGAAPYQKRQIQTDLSIFFQKLSNRVQRVLVGPRRRIAIAKAEFLSERFVGHERVWISSYTAN